MSEISDILEQVKGVSEQIKSLQETLESIKARKVERAFSEEIQILDAIIESLNEILEEHTETDRMLSNLLAQFEPQNKERIHDESVELGTSAEEMQDLLFEDDYNELMHKILEKLKDIKINTSIINSNLSRMFGKRSNYPNIQSPDKREAEEHSAGDEFAANIVDYATQKVEVRKQNAKAEQLAQDYEQQLPANQQSFDDK